MSIFISASAPFFGVYVFPALVSIALSGVAMAFFGVGVMVLRSAFHS